MTLGFGGEVAEYYAKYRHGYTGRVLDLLQESFGLDSDDLVLDLGCGTGQLAVPLAARARAVVGVDPEPDMLGLARAAAAAQGVRNATWVLGTDADVPALGALLGPGTLGATVIGNALHWMRHEELFRALRPLSRPGGGVAVLANGTPLWLQDSDWSRALREVLHAQFGWEMKTTCGTAGEERQRYAAALAAAGFVGVRETAVEYRDELTLEQLVGGVFSATPADLLPEPREREALAERIQRALPPGPYPESVPVAILVGLVPEA